MKQKILRTGCGVGAYLKGDTTALALSHRFSNSPRNAKALSYLIVRPNVTAVFAQSVPPIGPAFRMSSPCPIPRIRRSRTSLIHISVAV